MKNGSSLRAGKKLIALNQIKNVVVCLGFVASIPLKRDKSSVILELHQEKPQLSVNQMFCQKPFLLLLLSI